MKYTYMSSNLNVIDCLTFSNVSLTKNVSTYSCHFSYDHQKYLRSGVVYLTELFRLPPYITKEFKTEGFSVHWKDDKPFSSVSIDHATEWVNRQAKSTGGLANTTQINSATIK